MGEIEVGSILAGETIFPYKFFLSLLDEIERTIMYLHGFRRKRKHAFLYLFSMLSGGLCVSKVPQEAIQLSFNTGFGFLLYFSFKNPKSKWLTPPASLLPSLLTQLQLLLRLYLLMVNSKCGRILLSARRYKWRVSVVALLFFYFSFSLPKLGRRQVYSIPWRERNYCSEKYLFIYDVPSTFTTDLLSQNMFELVPGTKYAQWQSEYYLHQSLKSHPCRTKDPENAQIFFIPLYGSGMGGGRVKDRMNVKEKLFSWLKSQKSNSGVSYFDRNVGKDHVITLGASRSWCKPNNPHQRTSKCLGFTQQELFDSNLIKVSVEYTGLRTDHFLRADFEEKLSRIVIIPYLHFDVKSAFGHTFFQKDDAPYTTTAGRRRILLAFSGNLLPKKAPFRAIFKDFCDLSEECVFQNKENSRQVLKTGESSTLYSNSQFCAILGGDTRASKRLFDAIDSLCIPVIFDPLLALPFASDIPYDRFIVFSPFIRKTEDVRDTIHKLKQIPESEVVAKQNLILKYRNLLSYFRNDKVNAIDMIIMRIFKLGQDASEKSTERFVRDNYSDWRLIHEKVCNNSYAETRTCKVSKVRTQILF